MRNRTLQRRYSNSCAILGVGKVNLITGKCKYFNIFDTWDGTVEVWQSPGTYNKSPKFKLVFTAGTSSSVNNGDTRDFHQDQTGRAIGQWQKVADARVKDMTTLLSVCGNRVSGFTYK